MYRLETLSEDDFERLVNMLCQKILGTGTVSFTKGRDGGRDGRFEGKANNFPSNIKHWEGKFIIQAKHTSNPIASCSDNDFWENKSSIINGEIEKIKKLKLNNEIDYYLLFTNRKETGKREDARNFIVKETKIFGADIIGSDTIESYLKQHKDIVKLFGFDKYSLPFDFHEDDIKDTIIFFSQNIVRLNNHKTITEDDIKYISKEEKNKLNGLTQLYYDNEIRKKSLKYFTQIDTFLEDPINDNYMIMYENFSYELSNKISVKREIFERFEEIFAYIYDKIFEKHKLELSKDSRLIWIFLHHLYFNCHIGVTE